MTVKRCSPAASCALTAACPPGRKGLVALFLAARTTASWRPLVANDEYREDQTAARSAGLVKRHETREARAIRRQVAEEIAEAIENMLEDQHALGEGCKHCDLLRLASTAARRIGSREASE